MHAFLADYLGNLAYALTARNFNPIMAMAADTVIVTAEHIVPVGMISPDHIVTPAPVVDYLVANGLNRAMDAQTIIAKRIAQELRARHARQSRHRHPDAGRKLRSRRAWTFSSSPRTA